MSKLKPNDYEKEIEYYFKSLKHYRRLSSEEEKELGRRIQQGDEKALNTLVEHNLRFVVNIAKGYRDRGVSFADVISEGNLGLFHAARKYDPEKNIRFISYAVWWIRCYIKDFIEKQGCDLETSVENYKQFKYNEDQINERFEENLNKLNDRRSSIADLLKCLKDREREIIMMSFGLNDGKEMTLGEISDITSLSMERIRQIKDDAIMKLKCEVLTHSTEEIKEYKMLS